VYVKFLCGGQSTPGSSRRFVSAERSSQNVARELQGWHCFSSSLDADRRTTGCRARLTEVMVIVRLGRLSGVRKFRAEGGVRYTRPRLHSRRSRRKHPAGAQEKPVLKGGDDQTQGVDNTLTAHISRRFTVPSLRCKTWARLRHDVGWVCGYPSHSNKSCGAAG
jgi:hypothetical protein